MKIYRLEQNSYDDVSGEYLGSNEIFFLTKSEATVYQESNCCFLRCTVEEIEIGKPIYK